MQDRTSANSMKVLLQRTAGPYIWVIFDRSSRLRRLRNVCFAPIASKVLQGGQTSLSARPGRPTPRGIPQHGQPSHVLIPIRRA